MTDDRREVKEPPGKIRVSSELLLVREKYSLVRGCLHWAGISANFVDGWK